MLRQKLAEAIVGAGTDCRVEPVVPKLGQLILISIDEAQALAKEAGGKETDPSKWHEFGHQ